MYKLLDYCSILRRPLTLNLYHDLNCFVLFLLIALPKIISPAAIVRSLPRFVLSCSATGSPPIYTALIRKSKTLINTTNTASIKLYEAGNYTCMATNKHGTDVKNFSVIFNGQTVWKEINFPQGFRGISLLQNDLINPIFRPGLFQVFFELKYQEY